MQTSNKLTLFMSFVALCSGVLLALMIKLNSQLAMYSSPLLASWMAHGIGAITVLLMLFLLRKRLVGKEAKSTLNADASQSRLPWWAYLGGVPGAATVVLAAVTVNSELALAGTLALMLVGQLILSCIFDCCGYFGVVKRRIRFTEVIAMVMILLGAMLVIYSH
ncbi:DMT family transporter [Shewanella mangrovisoli]|uniref:DMT family transporter n=1 Tax=Shewanella mangrovisoli TaxID=2864211 RepID=A0ABV4VNH0_9GAMM